MKIIILILTLILLSVTLTQAATIHGNVYDIDLNLAKNTVLTIDSIPEQTYVSKDGKYSLTVNPGEYIIKAKYQERYSVYTLEQPVKIIEQGDFTLDLILFPDITDEQDILDQDINLEDPYKENISYLWYIVIVLVVGIISYLLYLKKKPKKKVIEEDDLTKKVLSFIKEQGGRTTQKDIRKKFPVSEAKISLVIAELEHKNILKKIKKGRGNIIILNP